MENTVVLDGRVSVDIEMDYRKLFQDWYDVDSEV